MGYYAPSVAARFAYKQAGKVKPSGEENYLIET
jgi:hypothetical protein